MNMPLADHRPCVGHPINSAMFPSQILMSVLLVLITVSLILLPPASTFLVTSSVLVTRVTVEMESHIVMVSVIHPMHTAPSSVLVVLLIGGSSYAIMLLT